MGFADHGLRTGADYRYRVAVSYRAPGGQARSSDGVVMRCRPEPEPEAVTDLDAQVPDDPDPGGDGVLVTLSWTPPRHGQVRLVRADEQPPWTPGTTPSPSAAAALPPVAGTSIHRRDGRDILDARLPTGRHWLVALSVTENAVAVGTPLAVRLAEPVRRLSAIRWRDDVQIAWEWPDDADAAVVTWPPDGQCRRTRRGYQDDGPPVVTIGPGQATIAVRAMYREPGGWVSSPALSVHVPARPVAVECRIRRQRLRGRRRIIVLITERAVCVPPLVVIFSTGPYPPDDPAEGEVIARIAWQSLTPAEVRRIAVKVPRGPGWVACFADPAAGGEQGAISLFPPPDDEMRSR